jgi:hypothetical protein
MAILGLQRQAARAGRIRLGETVSGVSKSGKTYTRPAKLDTFRFTSASRHAIESVAHVLGGNRQPVGAAGPAVAVHHGTGPGARPDPTGAEGHRVVDGDVGARHVCPQVRPGHGNPDGLPVPVPRR